MMKHQPERTCIGCRGAFKKDEVVRIVAGQDGIVIDYREKLPGRAAYVCPQVQCIKTAVGKDQFSKALRLKVRTPSLDDFIARLITSVEEKIKSLITMSVKAGKLAAGYSAVQDALEKGRVEMLLFAQDISEGTKEKVAIPAASIPHAALFSRDEFGRLLNREMIGVIGIEDKGLADAILKETGRLKGLIKTSD